MSRIIPIYTDACHCLMVDSDNTHLLPILRADKCMSVNGNKAVSLDTPSSWCLHCSSQWLLCNQTVSLPVSGAKWNKTSLDQNICRQSVHQCLYYTILDNLYTNQCLYYTIPSNCYLLYNSRYFCSRWWNISFTSTVCT